MSSTAILQYISFYVGRVASVVHQVARRGCCGHGRSPQGRPAKSQRHYIHSYFVLLPSSPPPYRLITTIIIVRLLFVPIVSPWRHWSSHPSQYLSHLNLKNLLEFLRYTGLLVLIF
ncbi:hypothetical protein ABW19_dt0203332 [Dactylella cylindrospora]|nr:hypothetical protein ABW19_dt0203332 [Dactylella cylindrospora]